MGGWGLSGQVLIACNCDWGCPCNFNALPSRGHCEGGWIWMIEKGHVDDTRLDGLGMALFAKWPGAIHDGGGRAAGFVDDRADAAQRTLLDKVLRGELGGPWGLFIRTYELSGAAVVKFEVDLAEHASRARIGSAVELELQTIRNPVTQAEVHPEVVLPEGLVVKRGSMAASEYFASEATWNSTTRASTRRSDDSTTHSSRVGAEASADAYIRITSFSPQKNFLLPISDLANEVASLYFPRDL